jgi:GYF domain 2
MMSDILNHPSMAGEKPRWHLARSGERHGPFTDSKLFALAGEDMIEPGDLVWRPGFTAWAQATDVPGLLTPPPLPQGMKTQPAADSMQPPPMPGASEDEAQAAKPAPTAAEMPLDLSSPTPGWSGNRNLDALRDALQRAPNYAP